MDGGKDWLEGILKRRAYDESPIKVLELNAGGSGPGKGENYLSKIHKIRAKVLLGSGRIKEVSFFVKCEHETENMKKMSVEGGVFVREIVMYRDVLPKMQELLEDINDPEGIFWPKCYDIRLYNRLLFEDLGDFGFRMANRLEQLSLNAALMCMRNFAKFHALSKILLDRGEIPMAIFEKNAWTTDPDAIEMTKKMIASNVKKMCKKMETWGDEWKEATDRLRVADLGERHVDSFNPKPEEFKVLCHNDAWTNNMMFGGEDLENPTAFRLIDLQICSLNSPARDIGQFLVTSVRLEDRRQNTDLLVQTYADTLKTYLLKLGYGGDVPTLEDVKNALARKSAVSLCEAIGFVPIVLGDAEHAPDFEKDMKELNEAKEKGVECNFDSFNVHENLTPVAESVIKYQIKEAMKMGLI